VPSPNVPALDEWKTASQVAAALGLSRQQVNKMIQGGKFKTAHVLGDQIYVVKREEVQKMQDELSSKKRQEATASE
jgi:hypothetical protein